VARRRQNRQAAARARHDSVVPAACRASTPCGGLASVFRCIRCPLMVGCAGGSQAVGVSLQL